MPTFDNIQQASMYMRSQLAIGLVCEQKFNLDGTISVFCKFTGSGGGKNSTGKQRVLPVSQRTLFGEPEPPPVLHEQTIFPQNRTIELPHELRDYQQQAVNFALMHRISIIEIPTGRGKTLIGLAIANEILKRRPGKILVLVPTTVLLTQWVEDGFSAAGMDAGAVGGGLNQWGETTVSTYQSAIRNLDKIPQYHIIIFDEVHHLFSPEYVKILYALQRSPDALSKYLIGLTATVREYGEGMTLQNRYFPNVFSKSLEEFQEGDARIPLEIKEVPIKLNDDEEMEYDGYTTAMNNARHSIGPIPDWNKYTHSADAGTRNTAWGAIRAYANVKKLLSEAPAKITKILEILHRNPGQFIIFSDSIDGIKNIENALSLNGITEGSIYSGIDPLTRRRILDGLKDGTKRVLVGGNAISEGLDLPDISNVILSSMLVSSSRTPVQRLGRVMRPKEGKHVKIFLLYAENTFEEKNAKKIYEILGEER